MQDELTPDEVWKQLCEEDEEYLRSKEKERLQQMEDIRRDLNKL